jgi:DNA-binding response OmpR family regulator
MPKALLSSTAQSGARADALARVQRSLSDQGWVVSLTKGDEILDVVAAGAVDVVLVDLPRVGGLEMLEEIRKRRPHQPVIILTQEVTPDTQSILERVLDLGGVDFLELTGKAPRAANEVALRARALLRRGPPARAPRKGPRDPKPGAIEPSLPELHDPATGKLDAGRLADYLGVSLKELSKALGTKYATVHKTPTSERLQPKLCRLKRILEILTSHLASREEVLAWLNSPHPDLDEETPLGLMLSGEDEAVRTLLENAQLGHPA